MAKMLVLLSLRGVNIPVKRLATSAGCYKKALVSCANIKNFNSHPGGLQQEIHKQRFSDQVLARQTLSQSQAENVWKSLKLISSTLGQLNSRIQVEANDTKSSNNIDMVSESTPAWPSYPKIHQRVTLLNGLFGCGRHCLLSYIKRGLGPASLNYVGLSVVPSRTYVDLPDMPYPKDKNGYTLAWDLGKEDRKTIQRIASEELQDVLKKLKIPFTLVKSWKNYKDDGTLFGASLEVLVQRDIQTNRIDDTKLLVPAVVQWIGDFIQVYGKKWDDVLKTDVNYKGVKEFQSRIEKFFYTNPDQFVTAPIYVMGHMGTCWKLLFLELPVPLMSSPEIEFFPEIYSFTVTEQVQILNLFILTMNLVHVDTLAYVVTVLNTLTKYPETKMEAMDFGRVFGPVWFKRFPADMAATEQESKQRELDSVTRMMVYYCERMFVVPPNLLNKLREINDKKQNTSTYPWSKKKAPEEKPQGLPSNIQVFDAATYNTETVPIDGKTTVKDVLAIYHGRQQEVSNYVSFCDLYEVGGNIEERILDSEVNMMDILELNPNAKFEMRFKRILFASQI